MHRRHLIACAAALPFWPAVARADRAAVFSLSGLAVHGCDVVAYFAQSRPVPGKPAEAVKWAGAIWRFVSAENRVAFEMNPRHYAPQYGGYCAYSMAQGRLAGTVPEAWTIHEGKLYLNQSVEARALWRQDIPRNVARADAFWPAVLRD